MSVLIETHAPFFDGWQVVDVCKVGVVSYVITSRVPSDNFSPELSPEDKVKSKLTHDKCVWRFRGRQDLQEVP